MMFQSFGYLKYSSDPLKLIVLVDQGIAEFYRSLVPKWMPIQRQRYAAHISVVRKETPKNWDFWKRYENRKVKFQYSHYIYYNETYYWLRVISPELEEVRRELGLPIHSSITRSPDGRHSFHITIGNRKC